MAVFSAIAGAVASALVGAIGATAAGIAGMVVAGAVIGAVVGGVTAAVTGGDIMKGMLRGGLIGGLSAGLLGGVDALAGGTMASDFALSGSQVAGVSNTAQGFQVAPGGGTELGGTTTSGAVTGGVPAAPVPSGAGGVSAGADKAGLLGSLGDKAQAALIQGGTTLASSLIAGEDESAADLERARADANAVKDPVRVGGLQMTGAGEFTGSMGRMLDSARVPTVTQAATPQATQVQQAGSRNMSYRPNVAQ